MDPGQNLGNEAKSYTKLRPKIGADIYKKDGLMLYFRMLWGISNHYTISKVKQN